MIDSRIEKLESRMYGKVEQIKWEALNRIKYWLGEVDRDVEIIPDSDPKKLIKLIESIKEDQLTNTEKIVVIDLFIF